MYRRLRFFAVSVWTCCTLTTQAQPVALDTLFAPTPQPFVQFGFDLATTTADGRVLLFVNEAFGGACPGQCGRVYAFSNSTDTGWVFEDSLRPPPGSQRLGTAVALTPGQTIPLGAVRGPGDAVSLWRRDAMTGLWDQEERVEGIDKPGSGGACFGCDIAAEVLASAEELVFVGAQNGGDDGGELREGSAYAFTRDSTTGTWLQEARLLAPDGEEGDRFGHAVVVLPTPGLPGGHPGDALALVGADRHASPLEPGGAVYAFRRHGHSRAWTLETEFHSPDPDSAAFFGSAVALMPLPGGAPGEALALIGAEGSIHLAIRGGAAYAFRRERVAAAPADSFRWVAEGRFLPSRAGLGLQFGHAVALAPDTLASGAPIALALVGSNPSGEVGGHPSEAGLWARTVAPGTGAVTWVRRAVYASGADTPTTFDWFGHSVALARSPDGEGVWAFVGAYYSNAALDQGHPGGKAAGAVFVYDARVTVGTEEAPDTPESDDALTLTLAPNPASGPVRVGYALAAPSPIILSVYDVLGRRVALVVEGMRAAGGHAAVFEAGRLPSGVYVVRLVAGGRAVTRRLTVVH